MEKTIKVGLPQGLHASNAAALVERASHFKADVHLKKGNSIINVKSILGLMSIVLKLGDEVQLTAEGPDEKEAIAAIEDFLAHT
ncbi:MULTISPECIES: HPr family phosphocarrier protein [Shouchella]|uniref:Phosphotransferase system, phosphocarrier protein HPr n=3 Tax=Bacillaceae TaxID=186817 RepID=A0A060LZ27_9BACI|nr:MULTISPECIES: HPr family phosphocarrier protein [Bacillaceae]RQW23074.1 HPr family phosphocarrier protein [Bacillus sp. C1-1]AIC93538.1 phosphotransferase system, phosphocarrier protein HPr [Shouchella lehensis G1]KQL58487.1 phosphocarrier protein Chr [Alkalicoccobacillus plakortidis]MBG9782765.1 phosphocarrier protein Chr [Shouchella lehensis]TES49898.1 HPr family phosphocarrier protein [Shouchella lehensis]